MLSGYRATIVSRGTLVGQARWFGLFHVKQFREMASLIRRQATKDFIIQPLLSVSSSRFYVFSY